MFGIVLTGEWQTGDEENQSKNKYKSYTSALGEKSPYDEDY